ncbi:MAG: VCBS repeat-containing protein [Planctomycetes bacterium]|nr:VCBS repeat-containing protein [Planctomycetota bacterium]
MVAARRVLWRLLRYRGRLRRWAIRERLGAFLAAAGRGRLIRVLREAAFAAAVAAALLGLPSARPAQALELKDVAAGLGGFAARGVGRLPSHTGESVAGAGDVNGDGIPDAIVGGSGCDYFCYTVPSYVVFGRADGAPVELEDIAKGQGGFAIRGENSGDYSGSSVSGAGDVNGDGIEDIAIGVSRSGSQYNQVDGAVDISDPITTLRHLFLGDPAPPAPGLENCGIDPTQDPLGCERSPEGCQ